MSLDFFIYRENKQQPCECTCGHRHFADKYEPVDDFNITHNLGQMAEVAGIYGCLWRPEEQYPPITTAAQCVPVLRDGLLMLKNMPELFRPMSSPNGWGTYEQFVPWVQRVLAACEANPDALVRASR